MTGPHLLYVAFGFPPSRAGGVYRALATVNAFVEAGWEVTVLTVPRDTFVTGIGADVGLEARIDPRVVVERVPFDAPQRVSDLADWSRFRARQPELWTVLDRVRDIRRFPEPAYGRWRPALEAAADRVHAAKPVDLVIGTANPHVDFVVGPHLATRHAVPYVMDYRDAWALDVFSGREIHADRSRAGRVERRMIDGAHEVWFVNEPIRAWHERRFPESAAKMHVVANGYDEYDAPLRVPVRPARGEGLRFGYVGTLTDQVPLAETIAGWRQARRRGAVRSEDRLVIHGYLGHFSDRSRAALALESVVPEDGIEFAGAVPKATIGEVYAGFDALVLILGTGEYVTSGKIFEYLATGIPVMSAHDPGNAASDVLAGSAAWVPARGLETDALADAFAAVARMASSQTPDGRAAAQHWAARFERRAQLAPRIAALRAHVEAP
ncbi:glycosyltransferase [Microbacterium sp. JZ31]|uniref:glycosyltransferase n=1 Tax=Microbacterium sp. JZ31 TaxID=1906274 RepID=UPI00193319D3|nr:glycosyltransferase [Microbacterium sp. JZ31]